MAFVFETFEPILEIGENILLESFSIFPAVFSQPSWSRYLQAGLFSKQ